MDITVNTFYYVLRRLNGGFQVYRRDQVMGPLLAAEPIDELEDEGEAQRVVDKLNAEKNSRVVTI